MAVPTSSQLHAYAFDLALEGPELLEKDAAITFAAGPFYLLDELGNFLTDELGNRLIAYNEIVDVYPLMLHASHSDLSLNSE